ncbi:hypothetical protein NDI47_00515 [Microcoleus vaginatus GB1-A2]|uniref:hypothetical protein n=1 Tax=Microcoleus vaginatus TaxID=119532 RepID=UPI001685DC8B|nr:hypothetical protein [Microcoleus sp. FACHB-61]
MKSKFIVWGAIIFNILNLIIVPCPYSLAGVDIELWLGLFGMVFGVIYVFYIAFNRTKILENVPNLAPKTVNISLILSCLTLSYYIYIKLPGTLIVSVIVGGRGDIVQVVQSPNQLKSIYCYYNGDLMLNDRDDTTGSCGLRLRYKLVPFIEKKIYSYDGQELYFRVNENENEPNVPPLPLKNTGDKAEALIVKEKKNICRIKWLNNNQIQIPTGEIISP